MPDVSMTTIGSPQGVIDAPIGEFCCNESNGDLYVKEVLGVNGWTMVVTDDDPRLTGGGLIQTVFEEITVDTTTTNNSFEDLLTKSITIVAGSDLLIHVTMSASVTGGNDKFCRAQVLVDGVAKRGFGITSKASANEPESGSLILKVTGLAAGAREVKLQWRVENTYTAQVRPVTTIEESCTMLLMEVTV